MVKLMVDEVKASTVIEKGPLPRHQKRGKIWPSLKGGGGVTLSETEGTHQNDMSTSKPRFTRCDDKKKP